MVADPSLHSQASGRLACPDCGNGGSFSTPYFTCTTCIYARERTRQALERAATMMVDKFGAHHAAGAIRALLSDGESVASEEKEE